MLRQRKEVVVEDSEWIKVSDPSPSSLSSPHNIKGFSHALARRFWVCLLVLFSLLALDVSLARLHYHYYLTNMRSQRLQAWEEIGNPVCAKKDRSSSSSFNCTRQVCSSWAWKLANERQSSVQKVRSFHFAGRLMAEAFDNLRERDQDGKIMKLLAERQCESLIESSVKSNFKADIGSFLAFVISLAGFVLAKALYI